MASSTDAAPDAAEVARLAALAGATIEGGRDGRGLRLGVVCAQFNGAITTRLLEGCLTELAACGVDRGDVTVAWVAGAVELPVVARAMATGPDAMDAVVCLGAVIRGATGHYEAVVAACVGGVTQVATTTGVPVVFGVLTCETLDQALERSEPGPQNKGAEAALAAVATARVLRDPRLAT